MPSIVQKSQKFSAAGGIVLSSSDVQEAENGLVTASLNYVIDPSTADRFNFSLDAPPPIYPRSYNISRLQNRALFMVERKLFYENGFVNVQATYAGALNVPQASVFMTEDYETLTTEFNIKVSLGIVSGYDYAGIISYRRKIIGYESATLSGITLPDRKPVTANELIESASYVSARIVQRVIGFSVSIPAREALLRQHTFTVATQEDTEFVTPSVKVKTIQYFPEVQPT